MDHGLAQEGWIREFMPHPARQQVQPSWAWFFRACAWATADAHPACSQRGTPVTMVVTGGPIDASK